jgi:small-conductance mechanosensitive channel
MHMLGVIALFPAARLVIHATGRANLTTFVGLFVLLFLDRIALALASLPAIASAAFMLALVIALGLAIRFARHGGPAGDAPWLRLAARLASLGLALALLAKIGGWANLAAMLGRSIMAIGVAAVYAYAGVIALTALLTYALASPTFRRSHMVDRNQTLLQRRLRRGLRWLGVAVWFNLVLAALGLRSAAVEGMRALLRAGVTVGEFSLSLGNVLAFVLTLLAAMLLARIVNGILEEDVYPRTALPRGIPYALSTLLRYGFYSLGFLFALAAAGVQLGQLAIWSAASALGSGRLQDLVKNFAAGLTLLFERRVQVGDTVQIPSQSISGRVLAIGIRATVLRNPNGVEVVVPNADLVSGAVSNSTLSDPMHPIEVPVGVAYGASRTRRRLLGVARSNVGCWPIRPRRRCSDWRNPRLRAARWTDDSTAPDERAGARGPPASAKPGSRSVPATQSPRERLAGGPGALSDVDQV